MWERTPPNPPAVASSKTRARSIRWRPASPCTPRYLRCILGPGQTHAGDGTHGGPQTTPATNTFRHCLHAYLLFLLLWHFISSHITCDAPTRTAVPYDKRVQNSNQKNSTIRSTRYDTAAVRLLCCGWMRRNRPPKYIYSFLTDATLDATLRAQSDWLMQR